MPVSSLWRHWVVTDTPGQDLAWGVVSAVRSGATLGTWDIGVALGNFYNTNNAFGASSSLLGIAAGNGLGAWGLVGTRMGTMPVSQLPKAYVFDPAKNTPGEPDGESRGWLD